MKVELASVDEGQCNSCGALGTWVKNLATGKRILMEGHIKHEIEARDGDVNMKEFVAHWASCPDADGWRRR